jgi:Tol biopolymer transport system component
MSADFWKYEGLGNDFVILESDRPRSLDPAWAKAVCDRHCGVGADGVLVVGVKNQRPFMRVVNADGSNPVNLTGGQGHSDVYPAWSLDGTQIVFARMVDDVRAVFRMNADGSGVTRVTPEGLPGAATGPYWSPAGDRIAYWGWNGESYDVYLVDPDGGNLVNLTDSPSNDLDPTWSPDGSRIAFESNRGGAPDEFTVAPDAVS